MIFKIRLIRTIILLILSILSNSSSCGFVGETSGDFLWQI